MKNIPKAYMALVIVCLFSCSLFQKDDPKRAAEAFVKAMSANDFDKAEKWITNDSKTLLKMIETVQSLGGQIPELYQMELLEAQKAQFTTLQMDKEKAMVKVEIGDETSTLTLRKEKDQWKVVLDQDELMDKIQSKQNDQ